MTVIGWLSVQTDAALASLAAPHTNRHTDQYWLVLSAHVEVNSYSIVLSMSPSVCKDSAQFRDLFCTLCFLWTRDNPVDCQTSLQFSPWEIGLFVVGE